MNISNFIKGLLPTFSKDTAVEDARLTIGEIRDTVIPAYDQAVKLLKSYKFKNKHLLELFGTFNRHAGGSKNVIEEIHSGLKEVINNAELASEMIKKSYSDEVAAMGLSYKKANMLQFLGYTAFVSKFSRKFLNYVYVLECAELDNGETNIVDSVSKMEIQWLEENFLSFCQAFKVVTLNSNKVSSQIENIPDIQVTSDNEQQLANMMGHSKIDPFAMRFIPMWIHPIYKLRVHIAEWQIKRHKAAIQEMRGLQLRRLYLEKLIANKPDPKLKKEIEIIETEIQDLNYKIAKFEEDAK